ncbi:MAG: hypothetical protein QM783_20030 [Phycisphaerales bacterium]
MHHVSAHALGPFAALAPRKLLDARLRRVGGKRPLDGAPALRSLGDAHLARNGEQIGVVVRVRPRNRVRERGGDPCTLDGTRVAVRDLC